MDVLKAAPQGKHGAKTLSPAEERKKRLAEALRKNLKLRKERMRSAEAGPGDLSVDDAKPVLVSE